MTFYVCKNCNYKHTFLPLVCAKCKGTNFYPLVTSEPTGNTSVCKGMEIQEDVLKLRIENEQLKKQIEQAKEIIKKLCGAVRALNNPNTELTDIDGFLSEAEQFLKE